MSRRVLLAEPQRKALIKEIDKRFSGERAEYEKFRVLCGAKTEPRRRRRMERDFRLRTKEGEIGAPVYNHCQRKFLAIAERCWHSGEPCRIICLKPRQTGSSTVIQHYMADETFNNAYRRAAVIAHKATISSKVLAMYQIVLRHLPYALPVESKRSQQVIFGDPLHSSIDIDSAEADDPGHGDTIQLLHCTEVSRWKDAERKMKGLLNTVPRKPGTLVVMESTANGRQGYFYETWEDAVAGRNDFTPLFFAWFEHEEYTLPPLGQEHRKRILDTLTVEEEELLRRVYFQRLVGYVTVSLEQLAWRRYAIANLCNGDIDAFNEQYPATPEIAFLSSGRPVFDHAQLDAIKAAMRPLLFRGDIEDLDFELRDAPAPRYEHKLNELGPPLDVEFVPQAEQRNYDPGEDETEPDADETADIEAAAAEWRAQQTPTRASHDEASFEEEMTDA